MSLYSYSYSAPYVIVILILFCLAYAEGRADDGIRKGKLVNTASAILILFFGLRGFIQSDFQNYYPWFEELPTLWDRNFFQAFADNYESGFVLYSILCKSIFPNYFFWIFISSLIDILLLKKIFNKYSVNVCLSFAIYFTIGAIIMEFNLMRNIKAILILVLATQYIKERRIGRYLLCVFLAMLFHVMAIIFIPLYFVLDKKWAKPVLWGIFITCMAVLLLRIKFISPLLVSVAGFLGGEYAVMLETYFSSGMLESSYGVSFGLIERVFTFFLIVYFYDKWEDKTGNKYIFLNMVIAYFMCFSLLAEMSVLLERFAYFFALSYCIFYPNLFKTLQIYSNKVLLAVYMFLLFTLKIAQQTQTIVCRYDNILFGIESFEERLSTLDVFNENAR